MHAHRQKHRHALTAAMAALGLLVGMNGPAAADPSTQVALTGQVAHGNTFTLGALQGFPATTQTDTYLSGGSPATNTFTGVPLYTLITDPAGGRYVSNLVSLEVFDGHPVPEPGTSLLLIAGLILLFAVRRGVGVPAGVRSGGR